MDAPAEIPSAQSLEELKSGHRELHAAFAAEMAALPPAVFFAPQGGFWSPAQHADHLVRSVEPLAKALAMPRVALRLLFGAGGSSRDPGEVVAGYLEKLAAGGGASGDYLPAAFAATDSQAQEELLARWSEVGRRLDKALGGWDDEDLDGYRLPHPLIGKLTVREMVAWSLYHGHHHRARIAERAAGGRA